jgi:hypothetical protein
VTRASPDYTAAIHEAAGHEDFDTTLAYVRAEQLFVGRVGEPSPTLPASLLGVEYRSGFRSESTQVLGIIASPTGFEGAFRGTNGNATQRSATFGGRSAGRIVA